MTVGEMIDFLKLFDREAVVLINATAGTPDPIAMSDTCTEWCTVMLEDESVKELPDDELAFLGESYIEMGRQPLFWPGWLSANDVRLR